MSRGPGRLQCRIVETYPDLMRDGDGTKSADMALPYALFDDPTESQKRSVRRALQSLRQRGLIAEKEATVSPVPAPSAAIRTEIIRQAEAGEPFTSEAVRAAFDGDSEAEREVRRHLANHPNSMGAQFRAVATQGRIVRTGTTWTSSRSSSTKGSRQWEWVGREVSAL